MIEEVFKDSVSKIQFFEVVSFFCVFFKQFHHFVTVMVFCLFQNWYENWEFWSSLAVELKTDLIKLSRDMSLYFIAVAFQSDKLFFIKAEQE